MNSLGSSAKWSSYDSLPSPRNFPLSESEQTEDEADIISEGEAYGGARKSFSADEGLVLSGGYLNFPGHSDELYSRSKNGPSEHCPGKIKRPDSASSPGTATIESSSATPGDLVFAQKCADLQRFICPLLQLLHGLKAGRYDKGLTSFQQSVAMDRLQRIVGILQRPEMGEKYLHNLLQIEMMLKLWFPQVAPRSTVTINPSITPKLLPHWCPNQLHMPVKKRKLTWSAPDCPGTGPQTHPHRGKREGCQAVTSLDTVSTGLPRAPKKQRTHAGGTADPSVGCWAEEFTDRTGASGRQPQVHPPSRCFCGPATQDNSVSSSAAIATADSP